MRMYDRFTERAQLAAQSAAEIIQRYGHNQIDTEHMLLALLEQPKGVVPHLVEMLGVELNSLIERLEYILRTTYHSSNYSVASGQIFITPRVKRIIDLSNEESLQMKDDFISTEHLFLAILSERNTPTDRLLNGAGLTRSKVKDAIQRLRATRQSLDPISTESDPTKGTNSSRSAQQARNNRINYLDFELKIWGQGGQYKAHVIQSPAGEATCTFNLPFNQDRLELLLMRLSHFRTPMRRIDTPELAAARELGGALFHAVFQGGIRDVLRSSLEKYRQQPNTGLRLKLRLQDAPEMANLPWEFLYDADFRRFLAQSIYTPVVRYMELPESIPPLHTALPLRILGMVASPSDYAHLDVERERSLVMQALQPLIQSRELEISWIEKATLKALRRSLQTGQYNIFHFIGHGGFDKQAEQGFLLFEDDLGRSARVDAERLGVLLHDHPSLRLAVLNSCEGARNTATDPFAGVATTLSQQGLPAVVAMQFSISDEAAIAFSSEFYTVLTSGDPVDTAVAEARKAIFTELSDVEWGTPVLFMRTADGILFEIS